MAERKTRRMKGENAQQEMLRRQIVYNGINEKAFDNAQTDIFRRFTGTSEQRARELLRGQYTPEGMRKINAEYNRQGRWSEMQERVNRVTGVSGMTAAERADRLASAVSTLYDAPQPRGGIGSNS